jgi:hypothetical protein
MRDRARCLQAGMNAMHPCRRSRRSRGRRRTRSTSRCAARDRPYWNA